MNSRGKLLIIPNEEVVIQEAFIKDVEIGKSHTYRIQEFSDVYNLGFHFTEADYQTAPCEIASLGHIVIKTEDEVSSVICYLPDRITDRQYKWFYQNINMLNKYTQINANSLISLNDGKCFKKINGMEEIMNEVRKKNILIEKGMKK